MDPREKKQEEPTPQGWRAIDLSEPPHGPLQRSVTSMNGSEEPEWPLGMNDDEGMLDEGDFRDEA